MPDKKRKVTLNDIAAETGFSANTVSHALNGRSDVKSDTLSIILDAASRLGYIPNTTAKSMRSGRTNIIAVIIPDLSNLYFSIMVKLIEKKLRKDGYDLIIMNSNEDSAEEIGCVTSAISKNVDGVIICPTQHSEKPLELMKNNGVPFVLFGRHFEIGKYPSVTLDEFTCGKILTEHLISLGHKKIAYIGAPYRVSSSAERRDGYLSAMNSKCYEPSLYSIDELDLLVERLTAKEKKHTAVFAFSDMMAWELITKLNEKGISVPDDVSVCGVDNLRSHINYPLDLTSVDNRKEEMTDRIIALLFDILDGKDRRENVMISPEMIVGATVGRI